MDNDFVLLLILQQIKVNYFISSYLSVGLLEFANWICPTALCCRSTLLHLLYFIKSGGVCLEKMSLHK